MLLYSHHDPHTRERVRGRRRGPLGRQRTCLRVPPACTTLLSQSHSSELTLLRDASRAAAAPVCAQPTAPAGVNAASFT